MIAGRVTMRGADGEGAPVPITEQVGDFNNVRHGPEGGFGGGLEGGVGTTVAATALHEKDRVAILRLGRGSRAAAYCISTYVR